MRKAFHSRETKYGLGLRSFLLFPCFLWSNLPNCESCLSDWMTYFLGEEKKETHLKVLHMQGKTLLHTASGLFVWTSSYLDALCAGLLQQLDGACVRCLLAAAVVPGQVAASGATRQLVAQLLGGQRVLQGGAAEAEAGRRWEEEGEERRGEDRKKTEWDKKNDFVSSLFETCAWIEQQEHYKKKPK